MCKSLQLHCNADSEKKNVPAERIFLFFEPQNQMAEKQMTKVMSCRYGAECRSKNFCKFDHPTLSQTVAEPLSAPCSQMAEAFDRENHPPATQHPWHTNKFQFKVNFEGKRLICAAGLLPLVVEDETLLVLLSEEDQLLPNSYPKRFKPALGPFGGKVDQKDAHWVHTAARELHEETGRLLPPAAIEHVRDFPGRENLGGPFKAGLWTAHTGAPANYQFLFYPVPAAHRQSWLCLPELYERTFHGAISSGWERSATKLHWVPCSQESQRLSLSMPYHACPNEEDCAKRCNQTHCAFRGQNLSSKFQLEEALALMYPNFREIRTSLEGQTEAKKFEDTAKCDGDAEKSGQVKMELGQQSEKEENAGGGKGSILAVAVEAVGGKKSRRRNSKSYSSRSRSRSISNDREKRQKKSTGSTRVNNRKRRERGRRGRSDSD